jgi:hydroxyacylglutathione hydrolase
MTPAYAEPGKGSMQSRRLIRTIPERNLPVSEIAIETIPCLTDNYAYLITAGDLCAVVDPSTADAVVSALRGRRLTHILNTHHHWDHSGGNRELKDMFGAEVVGPEEDRSRIPAIDTGVSEKTSWQFGGLKVPVLDVPAHTRGAVAYVFGRAAFTGDTMFAMGCGRLFEGTPAMMAASLAKIAALPDDTEVYCGHEYTQANGQFALSVEAGNAALQARVKEIADLRAKNRPTVPSTIAAEKATNPFLRTGSPEIRASLGMAGADDVAVFAELRRRKDVF